MRCPVCLSRSLMTKEVKPNGDAIMICASCDHEFLVRAS